jgi:hypothetical protein
VFTLGNAAILSGSKMVVGERFKHVGLLNTVQRTTVFVGGILKSNAEWCC